MCLEERLLTVSQGQSVGCWLSIGCFVLRKCEDGQPASGPHVHFGARFQTGGSVPSSGFVFKQSLVLGSQAKEEEEGRKLFLNLKTHEGV